MQPYAAAHWHAPRAAARHGHKQALSIPLMFNFTGIATRPWPGRLRRRTSDSPYSLQVASGPPGSGSDSDPTRRVIGLSPAQPLCGSPTGSGRPDRAGYRPALHSRSFVFIMASSKSEAMSVAALPVRPGPSSPSAGPADWEGDSENECQLDAQLYPLTKI